MNNCNYQYHNTNQGCIRFGETAKCCLCKKIRCHAHSKQINGKIYCKDHWRSTNGQGPDSTDEQLKQGRDCQKPPVEIGDQLEFNFEG